MSKMSKPDQTSPNVYTDTKKKMKPFQLTCQNCDELYGTMKDFKIHVRSYSHKKEVAQLFQTAVHQGLVFFPIIVVLNYLRDSSSCDPLIGLDMVTLCITPEKYGSFYLCHVCEERLSSQDVVKHLCSVDHYFKYLAYRNPELLRFAWFKNSFSYLQSSAKEENHINGSGTLRVLELPKMMLKRGKKMAYYQVMAMFSKMDKVTEQVRANRPRRKTLQAYITDPVRMNPLLGLNFLLEFSCPDSEWHCGYLCILCRQKVSAIESISHCISFDHVYWYMNDAHPATLECTKSSYTNYSYSFNKKILYLANLAQKENPPGEIESMHLDWSGFKEVDSSSYTNALSKLQQLRLERVQGEFKASVVPGEQFVYPPDTHVSCMAPTDDSTEQEAEVVRRESAQNGGSGPFILCVECNQTLSYISNYKKHIKGSEHKQKLAELFGPGLYSGPITDIQLYHYLWSHFGKVSSHPLIGLHLLTVFVDRWSQGSSPALYLCHACEINISSASTHLTSTQHYVNVFAHTKPDLVFLGSQNSSQVTKFAQEEELRQRKELILRVCEIPSHLWRKFKCLSYERIMAAIEKHNSKLSRCIEVQQRVTLQSYAKSSDRKSPLVGLQYMVKYSTTQPFPKCGYLCLLCERKLPEMHAIVHILSFTHIFAYLNIAHPGSLSKDDHEQTSLIVDLAQQAEAISPEKTLQEVELQFGKFHEVDTNPFKAALNALQSVFKQQGLGELTPSLVPGARLVSSVKKDCQKDSLQCIKQESSDSSHTQSSTSITDLKSLGLVPKCTERLRTTSPATNMISAKPSPAASTCTEFPVASFNAPQPDLLEMDTNPVSPAVPSPHTTVAKAFCTMSKPLQTLDLSFTEQQSKPAQDSGKPSEASEKLRQSSTCLKNKERDVFSVEKHCQKDSLRCIKQESSPTDLKSHGLVPKCTERLRTTSPASLDSTNMLSAEPSLTASTCTEFPVVSFNAPQPDLLEMDTDPVSPAVPSPHTTEAKAFCTMSKPLQTLDLSFTEQQSKPAQDSGEPSEASEKLRQSSTCLKNKERDVPQIPPASNILWNYMKTSIREPVIGLNSVIECHTDGQPPLYFCVSCTKTLKEISIIEHLTGRDHQKVYLKSVKYAPLLAKKKVKTKWLRSHAIMVEWSGGAGKTQVLELDAEDYHNLLSAPNLAALTKLRDSLLKISSEISDKNTAEASSSDVSRCDERLETSAIKTDGPCDAIRETVITDDSKCDTTLKHNSDALRSSPHLWAYLTSPKRTQPVIGLSMITEYRSFSGHNSFLCSCCKVVLSTSSYIGHLISPRHRFSYMKVKHPKLVEMWKGQFSLSCKISELEAKAHIVQDLEGWGHIKVVENDCPKKKEHIATGAENSTNEQELEASQTSGETKQQGQSHLKSTKLPKKEKMKKQTALIGVNFVTCVTHGKKKLFFCELCSVRCHLDHMSSVSHRKACVEHKYPGWTTSDAHMEKKLNKIALHLAAAERSTGIEMKKLTVPAKVFTALRTAPASEAMSELKLQLTKLKAQLDPRGSLACPEPNCKTASYHTEGKFAAAIPSLQQEQAPLPEMSVMPDTTENPQRGSHSWTVQSPAEPCSTVLSETWPRPQPSSAELKSAGESQLVSTHSICFEERRSTQTYNSLTFPIVTGHSNAYVFLSLRNLFRTEPIIGLSDIVECRAMSRPTFFLCLNCAEKISAKNFCCHMTSEHHQHCSILRRIPDPGIFQKWQINDKLTLRDLAGRLALMEQGFDAKVIKLDQKQYEILQSADFLNAIEMLQRMYGPIAGYNFLSSIRTGQNQKENSTAPLQQDRSETDENTPEHQPLQSCDLNPSQTQPRLHHSPVADRAFDRVQDSECTKISSPIKDQSQLSQSPEKTWKVSKTGVQAQAEPTQLQLKTDITAESDRDSGKETQTIPETHRTESTTLGVQHFLPSTIKIKQEKPDYGEVSPNKCCFGVNTATSLDAPHSGEVTVNPSKHKADLINSVNSKRESKSDAVVGLSSVIECRSNGQPSLYLCVACSSKLNHDLIINHLMKLGHRESYLRHRYPWFFENWPDSDTRTQRSVMLMQLAHQVEKTYEDEPGQPQEMELQCADLKEIKSLSYDKAIMQLQKIRKAQNLCALQTCISPKKQPVLVKQEKIETEVTTRHSPPPADLPEKTAQTPRTVSKRRNTEPDSSHMSPTVVKQIKLSSSLTSIEEMIKQPKLRTCDNQMPDPPSRHSSKTRAPENTIIEVSSKESLPQGHTNLKTKTKHKDKQSPSQFNADQTHVTCSSSAVSATRHINKYSHSTHKPTTSTKSSKKSEVQTKSEVESSAKTLKDHRSASNPQLIAQIPSGICSDKVALNEQSGSNISKTCLKRHCSESKAVSSLPRKKHFTGDPSSHLKQSPLVPDSPVPSESAIRRKTLDERLADFTHLQNSLSISLTFLSEGIQKSHPNVSGDPDPCTPAEMVPSYQPLNKTSILAPQQKHPCPSSSASSDPAMQAQGHEIARLHETSKKAQNYENQQFIPETLNTNLVAASSVESDWTITANEAVTSAYASTESSPMSYHIPSQNAHLYFSMTSNTSVTSPVIPGYAVPPQYFWYQQPDYFSPSASTIAHNYTVAVNENATNAEAVPPGHSANLGYLTNANSAYTSQVVNQSQVYPPVQSVQPPETLQAYHPFYAYNQGLQPDQVTTFSGSVTSAASANGHVPTG